jgi:hypothetical protein
MSDVEHMMFEMLKKIQVEQAASRERDAELLARLSRLEEMMLVQRRDLLGQEEGVYRQQTTLDRLTLRVERIEHRLELTDH